MRTDNISSKNECSKSRHRYSLAMQSDITVIDGGMGRELLRIGAPFRQPEWSALALMEDPESVRRAHQNFVDAGAEIITVNSYAVVPYHIGDDRFAARGAELAALAAEIAREVADQATAPVRVAGSVPPLFGSYEPQNFRPEEAPDLWRVLIEAQAPHVDLWIAETLSSIQEFTAVRAALKDRPEPFWAAFTLDDDLPATADEQRWAQLRSGESIAEVASLVDGGIEAVLFNCSQPERFEAAIAELATALAGSNVAIGAYANTFADKEEGYASNDVILADRQDLTPAVYAALVKRWIDAGATIVGGCCGIGPAHIHALTELA